MNAPGITALGLVHLEELLHFTEDLRKITGLVAAARLDGVGVHRVAAPQHLLAFTLYRADQRRQVIVCGTEAHVCVQQTALDLRWAGKEVFIVAEASGSREPANRDLAFARMRSHGIEIVSREMVAFEWLQRGGTELFREVNRDFIR